MKLLTQLVALFEKEEPKTLADHQREALVEVGVQQFTKLRELGLGIPVTIE